jgi:hypothetical protein
MGDDVPTLEQLIASGAVIERRPDHPLWWRATQADGSVFTFRESAYSHPLHGPEVWHGHKECWCLQDGPHERECEQGLYVDPWEDDSIWYSV